MRSNIAGIAVALALLHLGTTRICLAADVVVDQHWPANSDGVWEFFGQTVGTIFDVGATGVLDHVDLYLTARYQPPGSPNQVEDLRWTIRSVKDGLPEPPSVGPLASGVIAAASITDDYEPLVTLDVTPFDLAVESGDQLALCLSTNSPIPYRWLSYRGEDAPTGRDFKLYGTEWLHVPFNPVTSNPPYSAGYSTFIELVPEPASGVLAMFVAMHFVNQLRRRRRHR